MLDIGWSEMMIVGVVALIVVGPKDLPKMFHTLGEVTGKARGMAREFQSAMSAAARESGMGDVTGMAKTLRKANPTQALKDAVGFDEIDKEFRDIGHDRPAVRKPASPRVDPQPMDAGNDPGAINDESDLDEAAAADYDAEIAARNAEMSAVEAERLRKHKRSEAARLKAAAIRARKEADAAEAAAAAAAEENEAQAWQPRTPTPDPES